MAKTEPRDKEKFREGWLQSCHGCGDPEGMVRGYRGKSPSEDLNVHRP